MKDETFDVIVAGFGFAGAASAIAAPDESLRALAGGMASIAPFVQELADAAGAKTATNWVSANYPFEGGDAFGYISIEDIPGFDPARDFPWAPARRSWPTPSSPPSAASPRK